MQESKDCVSEEGMVEDEHVAAEVLLSDASNDCHVALDTVTLPS